MSPPAARGPVRYTLADTLAAVAPYLPATLVPPAAARAVRRAAARLPAALTPAFYLECRLGGSGAPVDLIFRVEGAGAALLAGRTPLPGWSPGPGRAPAWRGVAALCSRWLESRSPLARAVDHLWLELDLAQGGAASPPLPPPSLFAGLRGEAARSREPGHWRPLLDALAPLCGGVDGSTRAAALALLAGRPAGTSVPYLGVMAARRVPAVRIYLRGLRAAQVPGFLRAAGVPEAAARLEGVMAELERAAAPEIGMLHLDVAGAPLPRVGVEYTLARHPQLHGRLAETEFLDRLVAQGLCAAERRDGLAAWPGVRGCRLRHELWESVMARRVNCVKLVSSPQGVEAKGYLLAFHLPRPRSPAGAAPAPDAWRPGSSG